MALCRIYKNLNKYSIVKSESFILINHFKLQKNENNKLFISLIQINLNQIR